MPPHQPNNRIYFFTDRILSLCTELLAKLNQWVVFPGILLLVLADIALRNIINQPISWSHEVLGLLLFCAFFLHLPLCIREKELLQVDLIYLHLSLKHQIILDIASSILTCLFAIIVCWQGVLASYEMYLYEEQAYSLAIPYWPLALLTSISGGLIAMQSLLQAFFPSNSPSKRVTCE